MTIDEAKQNIIAYASMQAENLPMGMGIAFDMAIKALEEVYRYRAIGTVEECREATEKQKPKRPDYEGDGYADGQLVYDTWICPCCGKHYEIDCDDYDYCPNCGQKLEEFSEEMQQFGCSGMLPDMIEVVERGGVDGN